uniref:Myotubularin phosphatase domain-containing protein n=1 Tax=Echinostoma caproni TaxID=27848 RepID=A0A183AU37_9TREM
LYIRDRLICNILRICYTGHNLTYLVFSNAYCFQAIENLGRSPPKRERRSRWKNIVAACGSPFSWHWFNPFDQPPPLSPIFPEFKDDTFPLLSSVRSGSSTTLTETTLTSAHDGHGTDPSSSLLWSGTHAYRLVSGSRDILTL